MNTLKKISLPALALTVATHPVVVAAQTATDPLQTLETDGKALIIKIAALIGVLAIAMLGVKAIPAAFKYVASFVSK